MANLKRRVEKLEWAQCPGRPTYAACRDYARQLLELDSIDTGEISEGRVNAFADELFAEGKPLLTFEEILSELEREEQEGEIHAPN